MTMKAFFMIGIFGLMSVDAMASTSGQHWAKSQHSALASAKKSAKIRCENAIPTKFHTNCQQNTDGKPKTWDSGPNLKYVWMCEVTFQCSVDPNRKPISSLKKQ